MQELDRIPSHSLKGALEALLLVSTDAVPATEFARELGVAPSEAADALAELAAEYADTNRGFQLREVSGGWRLFTHPAHHDLVEQYVLSWDTRRLSQAALETLAVIAYHQPVTREGVKAIRGVNSDGVISSLRDKGLVREVGHEGERSRAILYGTTQRFLENFGLKGLRDLPPLEDFAPDEESKQFIRERLSGRAISSTLEEAASDIDDERELIDTDLDEDDASFDAAATDEVEDAEKSTPASDAVSGMLADALEGADEEYVDDEDAFDGEESEPEDVDDADADDDADEDDDDEIDEVD